MPSSAPTPESPSPSPQEERLAALGKQAGEFPTDPGVYLMRGSRGEVLYVGKAKSLRSRVRSYFQRGGDGRFQIAYLLRRVRSLEFVVTRTEKEAIILENTLIKKHKPPYNIVFRDDKTYLHVKLSTKDDWPRVYLVRRPRKDGSKHYGPYASAMSLRETLEVLQGAFPLRTCTDTEFRNRTRPCLEYEIGRCLGPCVGLVDKEKYGQMVRQVDLYLSGKREEVVREIEREMKKASDTQEYEKAARLRDRAAAMRRTFEKQQVANADGGERDVFALADAGEELWIHGLFVRGGSVVESRGFPVKRLGFEPPEVLSQFLGRFYSDENHSVPEEILLPVPIEDKGALSEWLSERREGKVLIQVPSRGSKKGLLHLAEMNAKEGAQQRTESARRQEAVLENLQKELSLPRLPRRIECFDISHLQGGACVASQVAFVNGVPDKNLYRKYELKDVPPGDDYRAMSQVLSRRYKKVIGGEETPAEDALPDLIMVDGGKGQLGVLEDVLAALGISKREDAPGRISLAKSRVLESKGASDFGRSDERVFVPGNPEPFVLKQNSAPLLLLARLRDESHRFAITYHRKLRGMAKFKSVLDDVRGVGPKRRIALLKHFESIDAIRKASEEELSKAPGMNAAAAKAVWKHFHGGVS
ncbi:MAG: excinuclease ABC subunit UvrC [Bdellovibrionota bacterium]